MRDVLQGPFLCEQHHLMRNLEAIVRRYSSGDALGARDVFHQAGRRTGARFYAPAQIEAWALGGDADLASWDERREQARTVMAELEGRVVGFSDLGDGGLLDMLFVHPVAGGRGVARALVSAVLDRARRTGVSRVVTHASRAALPVFESLGFVVDRENPENHVRDQMPAQGHDSLRTA